MTAPLRVSSVRVAPLTGDGQPSAWRDLGATTSVEFTPAYDAPDAEAVAATARAFARGLPAVTVHFQLAAGAFDRLAALLGLYLPDDRAAHDRWADDGGPTPDDDQEPTR